MLLVLAHMIRASDLGITATTTPRMGVKRIFRLIPTAARAVTTAPPVSPTRHVSFYPTAMFADVFPTRTVEMILQLAMADNANKEG